MEETATSAASPPPVPPSFGQGPAPDSGKGFFWPSSMEIFPSVEQRTASFNCLQLGRGVAFTVLTEGSQAGSGGGTPTPTPRRKCVLGRTGLESLLFFFPSLNKKIDDS